MIVAKRPTFTLWFDVEDAATEKYGKTAVSWCQQPE